MKVVLLLVLIVVVASMGNQRYDTALYEVESPVFTWVVALGSYL